MQLLVPVPCCALIMSNNKPMRHLGPWQSHTKTHSAWVCSYWALALGHLIGQPTGLLGVQWWKLCTHILFYSCYLFYMPNPFRNLGLAQVGPGFVRGSQLCIHSTCGKRACNQKFMKISSQKHWVYDTWSAGGLYFARVFF